MQTLQWVQDTEGVEARSGQVAEWEEDQAPCYAKQNGDSQQGTHVSLGSVTVPLLKLTVDNDTSAGHTMDKDNQKPDRIAGHQNCFWWLCPDYTSWVEWDLSFLICLKLCPQESYSIMSSSLWVPSVRECTVVDFIQYVRRELWFDWVRIKQLDQNHLNIKVEIKKKRCSYFFLLSMNHMKRSKQTIYCMC